MSPKFSIFLLALMIALAACGPSPAPVATAIVVPQEIENTVVPQQPTIAATEAAAVPKHKDLTFVEFFAVTWVECREMEPIVNGLKKDYASCMKVERVNYHKWSEWHELLYPLAAPEFDLLDSSQKLLYRWFGVVDKEEFAAILNPLCG